MTNTFGISEKSFGLLQQTFKGYPQVDGVVLFGSRAKGNYRAGSDIDLAIKGAGCTAILALDIKAILNEQLPIPYAVDAVEYNSLDNAELKAHIDRAGLVFFKREGHNV